MGDVVILPGWTALPIPVERVLDGAKHCSHVLVLGWDEHGEFYAAASQTTGNLELAAKFQHKLLAGDYG